MVPVVYTMGKVGSSAVFRALERANLTGFHIHYLEAKMLLEMAHRRISVGTFPPGHVATSMAIRDRALKKPANWLFITMVREPISRNLSAFFQNFDRYKTDVRDVNDADGVLEDFTRIYDQDIPLTWLDQELRDQLGIDVYAHPFPKDERFLYLSEHRTLIFRDDCPDSVKRTVLSDLLKREITVERDNSGAGKKYGDLYAKVKQKASFSREFFDRMYGSKYARRFLTDEELEGFRAKFSEQ